MSPPVIIAVIAGITLGVTVVVLLVRGSYQLGKLVNKVDNQEAKIDRLDTKIDRVDAKIDALATVVNELRAEVQHTNKILVGLANHTDDAAGRTVFTIPS